MTVSVRNWERQNRTINIGCYRKEVLETADAQKIMEVRRMLHERQEWSKWL